MSTKTVTVLFPVYIELDTNDTLDSVIDRAADVLQTSTIKPLVLSESGSEIYDDADLFI